MIDYHINGYISLDPLLPNQLLDEIIQITHKYPPTRQIDLWKKEPKIRDLATNSEILKYLHQLYDRPPIPFQTLNFHHSPQQPVHVDTLHFNCFPHGYMCGVWIALEDITEENGPLFYYPKSHHLHFHDLTDIGLTPTTDTNKYHTNLHDYSEWLQKRLDTLGYKRQIFTCPKGHALIWAANLAHGSIAIINPTKTRHSQVNHYYFEDCTYYIPAYSNIAASRIHYKTITDIRTNEQVPQKFKPPQQFII